MKKILFFIVVVFSTLSLESQLPRPDHVVIVILENRGYPYIVGNQSKAPYINSLLADTNVAHFTQSYALTNPSQPNYLMLYSGTNQGVITDTVPDDIPYNTCNLGANMIEKGFTIYSYSEGLPSTGYLGNQSGSYVKRHNPVAYWQGTGQNQTPPEINRPYSDFPSDCSMLPDLSFVIPDLDHNMHNGGTLAGDQWFENELKPYIDWARQNNSLLILTFDEDDGNYNNHILTFFYGPMIKGGTYSSHIDHYDLLATLEMMYDLSFCANSDSATPINYVWKNMPTAIAGIQEDQQLIEVFPSPATEKVSVRINKNLSNGCTTLRITDVYGKSVLKIVRPVKSGRKFDIDISSLKPGIYCLTLTADRSSTIKKLIIR